MIYYWISTGIIYSMILIALIVSIKNHRYNKNTSEKYFPIFLAITVLTEAISTYTVWGIGVSASKISDVYGFISLTFYILWFYKLLNNKTLLILSFILLLGGYSSDIGLNFTLKSEFPIRVVFSAVIILISVFSFFQKQILSNDRHNYLQMSPFWISIGLLVYQVTLMPVLLFLPNLSRLEWELNIVIVFINVVLYGCMIYALRLRSTHE